MTSDSEQDCYAESSNWSRAVVMLGPRRLKWTKPAAAADRGGRARLVLMTLELAK